MTYDETAVLLAAVAVFYPGRITPGPEAVSLWTEMVGDLEAAEANRALRAHVATSQHPPTVADIRRLVADERSPGVDVDTAWDEIRRAIGRCGRDREPQWSSTHVASAVQAIGWREICNTLDDDLPSLRAQLRMCLEASVRRGTRQANVGSLESGRTEGRLRSAGDAVRALLGQTVKPEGHL